MSFFTRHTLACIGSLIFLVFIGLVLWGYNNDLERILPKQTTYSPEQGAVISAYHNRPHTPNLHLQVAHTLTQNPIKKVAFAILLSLKSKDKSLAAYVQYTQFGAVTSLSKAAPYYFSVSMSHLTIGETLLLLEKANHPDFPITSPQIAFQKRDALLQDLHTRKMLSPSQYQTEHQKPLAQATDHRPIY